ncbi:MAG: type IV toxin-antitoxin system AbiEi family antitoxin [Actinomycetota bacterium]|nr:type IV toxin-antitoxin system AbiEi family antitoxin [Actinomycetota bacterium]
MKELELIEQLPEALRACLENVPRTSIEATQREQLLTNGMRADLIVSLSILGRKRTMVIEAKGSGQPKRAREAADQLKRFLLDDRLKGAYPVFAAPYVSEASAAICQESQIGFFDLAGNCRFALDDIYVEKTSADNPLKEKRNEASLFTPKSSRILRVLLNEPQRDWQVQQLSKAAEVSIGLASKIKRQLEDREWIVVGQSGIRLTQPEAMLQAWATVYSYKQNQVREYYTLDDLSDAETTIADWCRESEVEYALTGFSGARLSSPRVRYNRASVYVRSRMDSLTENTGLKPVDTGGNVLLLKPYDDGVFNGARVHYEMRTVCPVQLYLDLQSMAGRGEEAAEEILARELRPSW